MIGLLMSLVLAGMSTYSGAAAGCWKFTSTDGAKAQVFNSQSALFTYINAGSPSSSCDANPSLPIRPTGTGMPAMQVRKKDLAHTADCVSAWIAVDVALTWLAEQVPSSVRGP